MRADPYKECQSVRKSGFVCGEQPQATEPDRRGTFTNARAPERANRAAASALRRGWTGSNRLASRDVDPDLIDEDAGLHRNLAALGDPALVEHRGILEGPQPYGDAILQALVARPSASELATLLAMADTDEVVQLRLLRAIKDLGA